ncbi:MAG: YceI family protein [Rhodanobacter sp.]
MRSMLMLMSLLLACATSSAQAAPLPLKLAGSSITFTFKQMNVPVDGRFTRFDGQFDFDAAKPQAAHIEMNVDVASVSIGEDADPEVVKPTWLAATTHPQARFVSRSVKALSGNRFEATGALSIKGVSREIAVPFTYVAQGSGAQVDGGFTLHRADYKIGDGEWSAFDIVANDVAVKFHLALGVPASSHQ